MCLRITCYTLLIWRWCFIVMLPRVLVFNKEVKKNDKSRTTFVNFAQIPLCWAIAMVPWHFANGLCQELGIWQLQLMTVAYSTSAQGIFKCSLCNMLEIGNISLPLNHSEGSWSLVYVSIYVADGYLKLLKANTARGQLRNLMEMGVKLMHIRNLLFYLLVIVKTTKVKKKKKQY